MNEPLIVHASCVAHAGRGVLIIGPSGAGKSRLALRMMALGARLVADDRTAITLEEGRPVARCPERLRGLIEVRGVGLLRAEAQEAAPLAMVADLGREETERLPPLRQTTVLGCSLPLVLRLQNDHLAEALLLYLAGGRHE